MKRTIWLLAGLGFAAPVFAAPSVPVKCGANMERVWVYDDLGTMDVSARLRCGTPVDVIALEKGYVKVRTADGNEGYVPTDAIPASELSTLNAALSASGPAPVPTLASAAQANRQQFVVAAQPVAMQPAPQPIAPQQAVQQPAVAQMIPARDVAPVMVAARVSATPAPAPAPAPALAPVPAAAPAMNVVPPQPAVPAPATPPAQESKPAPSYVPAPTQEPAPAPSALPATHATAAPAVAPRPVTAVKSAPKPAPAAQPVAVVAMVTQRPAVASSAMVAPQRQSPREEAALSIEAVSQPAPVAAPMMATVVKAADVTSTNRIMVRKAEYSDDDEALPQTAAPASDLGSCSVYFSAYGVTPMQDKWIAGDLRKKFPGVCPAPEPSMVDYVVIFTHDMDFFTTTLPDPIHTDRNGFSDWSPVTAVDSTAIPVSELDKAHHEYAWVFRVHRGSFDPSKFTSRRRPQFTKTESSMHASSKSIEDAMQFISETGASSAQ
jgi:hypothetical protein